MLLQQESGSMAGSVFLLLSLLKKKHITRLALELLELLEGTVCRMCSEEGNLSGLGGAARGSSGGLAGCHGARDRPIRGLY